MKNVILTIILVLMSACSKSNGVKFAPSSPPPVTNQLEIINIIFDRSGPLMSGDIYLDHAMDEETLLTEIWINEGLEILTLGYTEVDGCLRDRGVVGIFYEMEGNRFSFYFALNDLPVRYSDLWGCEMNINIQVKDLNTINQGI